MPGKRYDHRVNFFTEVEATPKNRWLLGRLLALTLLVGSGFVAARYGDSVRDLMTGVSHESPASVAHATAEKPAPQSKSSRKPSSKSPAESAVTEEPESPAPPMAASVVRKPFALDVITDGGQHRVVRTHSGSVYLDLHQPPGAAAVPTAEPGNIGGAVNAVEQAPLSLDVTDSGTIPADSVHNLLAKRKLKTQGAVVLLARIGKDGEVQDLQMLSGPQDLFEAAREAVQPWRFKPYYKMGKAVESEIKITVNFAISAH